MPKSLSALLYTGCAEMYKCNNKWRSSPNRALVSQRDFKNTTQNRHTCSLQTFFLHYVQIMLVYESFQVRQTCHQPRFLPVVCTIGEAGLFVFAYMSLTIAAAAVDALGRQHSKGLLLLHLLTCKLLLQ